MDWSNERYVRLYVRDTKTWKKARWEGQCLFMMLLRIVDRAGILDDIEDPIEDLALMTGLPEEHVRAGYVHLEKSGAVELRGSYLILPNFIDAQEASKTDAQRQRESREGRRAKALAVTKRDSGELDCDSNNHKCDDKSQVVTDGHNQSQVVTPTCALHGSAVPGGTLLDGATPKRKISKKKKTPTAPDDFAFFWEAYPKKTGKKAAQKAWGVAGKDGLPGIEAVLKAVLEQVKSKAWADKQFIPNPATWLNQGRWDDVVEKEQNSPYPTQRELDRMTAQERLYWRNRISLEKDLRDDSTDN